MKQTRILFFTVFMTIMAVFVIDISLISEVQAADYEQLRVQNNHKWAESPKMIHTTKPAVAFAFAGLTKPDVVHQTLDWLKKNNAKGTFFVMENELRANPQLVQDIVSSGNEAAVGIRSLKNSDYYTTCRQITNVKKGLAAYGVRTDIACSRGARLRIARAKLYRQWACRCFRRR